MIVLLLLWRDNLKLYHLETVTRSPQANGCTLTEQQMNLSLKSIKSRVDFFLRMRQVKSDLSSSCPVYIFRRC